MGSNVLVTSLASVEKSHVLPKTNLGDEDGGILALEGGQAPGPQHAHSQELFCVHLSDFRLKHHEILVTSILTSV
jgi:hypothetical protein